MRQKPNSRRGRPGLHSAQKTRTRGGHVALLPVVGAIVMAALSFLQAPVAQAAAPKALINGDTVSGSPSAEETAAVSAGFAVTVVSGATWSAMTAAQFASYQVLIAGDPACSTLSTSFTGNAATWAPVVMGKSVNSQVDNRILIGTDPVFHFSQRAPRNSSRTASSSPAHSPAAPAHTWTSRAPTTVRASPY